jgi:methylglutaconyl-CoA hydratase
LQAGFDRLKDDPDVRVVVLAGAGPVFSAGADLQALERLQVASSEENLDDSRALSRLFDTVYTFPAPVIARVHGHAIAGGCGLAAVCDLAVAAEDAKFGFTEVRIGFVPALVSVYLIRKLGEASMRSLLLRGHLVPATEAVRCGLITEVVRGAQLDDRVRALAEEMAATTSASAIAMTKTLMGTLRGMGYEEARTYAEQMNAFMRGTADCKAGVAAFLGKKPMPWSKAPE